MSGGDRSLFRSLVRDYLATVAVQWFVLASGLYLFHLVAARGGPAAFAYYQIARGVVSTLQPVVTAGLAQALHRYLPRTWETTVGLARRAFAVQVVLAAGTVTAGIVTAPWTGRLLGLPGAEAATATSIMLAGVCLCTVAVAALRGAQQVTHANVVSGTALGLVPLAAFALSGDTGDFLVLQGAGAALVAVGGLLTVRRRRSAAPSPHSRPEPRITGLLRYGVRRLPTDLALPLLFTYPTLLVAAVLPGAPQAGYVGFVTSAVIMVCSLFGTLSPVLLPRLSRMFHWRAEPVTGRRVLTWLPVAAGGVAALAAGLITLLGPVLVRLYLGPEFHEAAAVLGVGIFAAVPLAMFYAARPTLDALPQPPRINRLLLGCLGLEVVLGWAATGIMPAAQAALTALTVAATVLGLATTRLVKRSLAPVPA
ncbi:lipopolysaccharide biosynthesis protein [Actinoplanes utahensis]|uniref:Polysaccharide biosynthesis protein n=1 Tax=Actinoplanes utahensis TaxID=1869 RepID=A0A0A6X3G8_ACTUT|nr:oligosaccharide flippase family protein [Actinoplanes utahensis]KHD74657.1 hypothetical protein MB27_27605 [Actinoplanes utahensis]GIF31496.1 hypothetical protein Aut01nite_44820 [Actinoplanes utahensis]